MPVNSFSDFIARQKSDPDGDAQDNPVVDPTTTDVSQLPALFATIHHQSESRPDGYTPEEITDLNNRANAHLPHLQTENLPDVTD
jgi:hypothetical protein